MTARVSTLLHVGPAGGRYVFLLVAWNDYADSLRDELSRQAEAFGLDLGPAGLFVEGYPQRMYQIADEVIRKSWPEDIARRFASDPDPIILVFDRDWSEFDPQEHAFAVIWVSDLEPDAVRPLLQQLALRARRGDDVIDYLRGVAEKERRAELRRTAHRRFGRLARVASYVEVKPSVLGVSVDVKAILRDVADQPD